MIPYTQHFLNDKVIEIEDWLLSRGCQGLEELGAGKQGMWLRKDIM